MEQLDQTEIEILKELDVYAGGIYLYWRLLNLKADEMNIAHSTKFKYKKLLKELFGIDITKRHIEKQEVEL